MNYFIALYFFVMAVILSGLLYISHTSGDASMHRQSWRYWAIALALDVAGLAFFAVFFLSADALAEPRTMGTLANTGLFGAFVYQALSFRALRQPLPAKTAHVAWMVVALFGLTWQLGKGFATPEVKAMWFGVATTVVLIWQIVETHQNQKQLALSYPLRMVMFVIVAELVWTVVRIAAFAGMAHPMLRMEHIPGLAIAATWLQLAFKVLGYAAITGYWVEVVTDAKARVDMENQAFRVLSHQQEKLIADLGRLNKASTSGVLAASIAHELNQPLQSAVLNHDMLVRELAVTPCDEAAVKELLQAQSQSLQRMSDIIQTMRGVFSESGAKPQVVELSRLIEGLNPLISAQAQKHGIALHHTYEGEALVRVKASEMQQVILNFLGNAFDALIASNTPEPTVRIRVVAKTDAVVCTVEDNGPGIAADLHDEMFMILKTTKHSGMGLGLWLARYITERNHGSIEIGESALGGALLSVRLPKVNPSLA